MKETESSYCLRSKSQFGFDCSLACCFHINLQELDIRKNVCDLNQTKGILKSNHNAKAMKVKHKFYFMKLEDSTNYYSNYKAFQL